jgi:hypothetical protein
MKSSSSNNRWLGRTIGLALGPLSLAMLVASNKAHGNYMVMAHIAALVICLAGALQLLSGARSWLRILGSGFICGLVHGTWGFLIVIFPPHDNVGYYFRGLEGGIIMFIMYGVFTGTLATLASGIFELFVSGFRQSNQSS